MLDGWRAFRVSSAIGDDVRPTFRPRGPRLRAIDRMNPFVLFSPVSERKTKKMRVCVFLQYDECVLIIQRTAVSGHVHRLYCMYPRWPCAIHPNLRGQCPPLSIYFIQAAKYPCMCVVINHFLSSPFLACDVLGLPNDHGPSSHETLTVLLFSSLRLASRNLRPSRVLVGSCPRNILYHSLDL